MFGNKKDKNDRLHQLVAIVKSHRPNSISQAELARRLGVGRSTVLKDLGILEQQSLYLVEDSDGNLSYPDWLD